VSVDDDNVGEVYKLIDALILCINYACQKTTVHTMIRREVPTWERNTPQSAIRGVLIGRISVLTQPISFQMVIIARH